KDRIKDEYVARVTHDIKGHLAAIQSCLFVASSDKSGPLTEKQADFLGRATSRNEQLTAFVRELLNLTQMRLSGHVESREFSLADSISKALETVSRKAEDKSITLTSSIDERVGSMTGDEFSINELITNLLFNAIKYTPEEKTVHLAATVEDGSIRMDFTDTGIGIPADEVDHVFDEFFRATNAKKSANEGTGLGLSIVKQIVERHGGAISVMSTEGEGSTFTVRFPVSP
ncbi:MAG TPA: HAMP domain-containing sensor histidine kinase, partial [Candidatus Krumholzibacterium sp.]|nr:HAMP domain-containing sensor histidine kinase [Candidatus Krumholzibacterium sp.]